MKESSHDEISPIMNHTKWEELRSAMLRQNPPYKWSSKPLGKDFIYGPDGEWHYHFNVGNFNDIEWVEIHAENEQHLECLLAILRKIHLPGLTLPLSARIYGYQKPGQEIGWI